MAETEVISEKRAGDVEAPASAASEAPEKEQAPKTSFFTFFQLLVYANPTWRDFALLVVGTISAIASGVPFPLMGIIFGQLLDDMNSGSCDNSDAALITDPVAAKQLQDDLQGEVNKKVLILVYLGIASLVLIYTYIVCWNLFSQRLAQRLREKYFITLLGQDAAFFDTRKAGEVSTRLNSDIQVVQSGTSEKVGMYIATISFFITAYVVGFTRDAKLAGMLISLAPAFLLMALVGGHYVEKFTGAISSAVGHASSRRAPPREEVFREHARGPPGWYQKAQTSAVQAGSLYFIAFSANALAFWQGSIKIAQAVEGGGGEASIGRIYTVVFLIVDACVLLSQVAPFLSLFSAASASFVKLREDISHLPTINGTGDQGLKPASVNGTIEFKDVEFAYPSRPDQRTLNGVSIKIPAGKHTAVVGPSGGGKSTIVSLIMRLYDPYVRSLIGMVQQEPTLLNRSVMENIALGLFNSANPSHADLQSALLSADLSNLAEDIRAGKDLIAAAASYSAGVQTIAKLVSEAADLADASPFIQKLQFGFGTLVGTSGSQLSGGQRQRVALARALIRDPKILVLDEATASLDSATEQRIQANLEQITQGRALLSVAHRLSTIKNADNIIVFKAGLVVEQGTHAELVALGGEYAELVRLQSLKNDDDDDNASTVREESSIELAKIEPVASARSEKAAVVAAGTTEVPASSGTGSDASKPVEDDDALKKPMGGGVVAKKILYFIRPNLHFIFIGFVAAFIVGCTYSATGVIFGQTVGKVNSCTNPDRIRSLGKLMGGMFFMLAVVEFLANFTSWSSFGYLSEKLLYRLRVLSFRSLFKQGLDFHQSHSRDPASLLSIITKDTAELGGFSGSVAGTMIAVTVNLIVAIILSHVMAWKIALVCLVLIPIQFGAGIMQMIELARHQRRHTEAFGKAVGITVEAVNSIKTISTLSLEQEVYQTYRRVLKQPRKAMAGASAYVNLYLAIAYSVGNFIYSFAYWWGAKLIIKESTPRPSSSPSSSPCSSHKSEKDAEASVGSAKGAALPVRAGGLKVAFKDVTFAYPARPELTILDRVSFELEPGKFCGLVGPSGAGKSTIMALVQGMFDVPSGSVQLDGAEVSRLDGDSFRDQIALVPQDPALFDGTVRFNVGLGARAGEEATQEEIEAACKIANMHDVIMALPQGYDTECGPNGSRLSGGQRQRLAIARALVRKPRLLLLDESTSALDAENERALQEGLERAAKGITVLAITHRIHTVRRADVILVVEEAVSWTRERTTT
ncbi:unnamed protein product [Parascedosporium putredinis]|uniref:Uncharacterized protein n=1 Tax=Parascedosporium putredinis TaxID=1442378 RepID=A0A9P1GVW9_9PEZI|nr:unnamed protein product [Parascedosporium putredinis]CAI7988888.1 unnamed protein product [Parascedosporium putredinis]